MSAHPGSPHAPVRRAVELTQRMLDCARAGDLPACATLLEARGALLAAAEGARASGAAPDPADAALGASLRALENELLGMLVVGKAEIVAALGALRARRGNPWREAHSSPELLDQRV
jgi:hypothetical protein